MRSIGPLVTIAATFGGLFFGGTHSMSTLRADPGWHTFACDPSDTIWQVQDSRCGNPECPQAQTGIPQGKGRQFCRRCSQASLWIPLSACPYNFSGCNSISIPSRVSSLHDPQCQGGTGVHHSRALSNCIRCSASFEQMVWTCLYPDCRVTLDTVPICQNCKRASGT
ncbi:hypothetical protein PGT21_013631 [Puccinia graminis f. sp. tritici]|uniref:Uncharacterized protein n=1 Tax=Puccinia graminis f. sp. tritici TaxID=56615 RepID=A0A5B0QMZ1_PUCGR|nr:hypothetical protein PGT21_013631 [Puccinia graminis f. sp. tritici]